MLSRPWPNLPVTALELAEVMVERPLCSISKTLTSASPAHVTSVRSFEWGINLTENILAVWPVATVVVRENGKLEDSG